MARLASGDSDPPNFLFATCQVGAERTLKSEVARLWPDFHFAFSRPGFVTFKLPAERRLQDDFDLRSVFARAYGFSLGKVTAAELDERARQFWQVAGPLPCEALHVWQRDIAPGGARDFTPHMTSAAGEALATLQRTAPSGAAESFSANAVARPGQLVLDCILVEPDQWWAGYHRAASGPSCLAGGLREIELPSEAVSRAYLKMEEALAWSGLPIRSGQRFAEVGCAPGGASQALLTHGLHVIGIDPAKVDPRVLANKKFQHIQKRGSEVRRREFVGISWLAADMNVAPEFTLDTVEGIVTHPAVNIRGLLLTLKLLDWKLAEEIPAYLERVRSWGYVQLRARQLAYGRQEICVTAVRRKPRRIALKAPGTRSKRQRKTPE